MVRAKILICLALLAACGDDAGPAAPADAGPDSAVLEGGEVQLDQCGYALTTRIGASAPQPSRALLGPAPTPHQLHLGIAGNPTTSMVVSWRTTDETTLATTVQYGKTAVTEHSQDGHSFIYNATFSTDGPYVRVHETHLCGLEPDTQYTYRVGGVGEGGAEAWSTEHTFRTAPDLAVDPSAEVVVLVLGDTRNGYDTFGTLLALGQQMASPDLVLFTGDAITLGPLQLEWDLFFDAAEPVLASVPMVSAHGNHEANAINYYALEAMPGNEERFSFEYGPLHLAVLNDTPDDLTEWQNEIPAFLEADLTAADAAGAPWKIVMHHRPLYSSAKNHGSDLTLRGLWEPIYDAHHVDVVLNGHDHNYERSFFMHAGAVAADAASGTLYLVAGGAGAVLYENGSDFWTAKSASVQNLVLLRVRPGQLVLEAYDEAGALIDSVTIDKP